MFIGAPSRLVAATRSLVHLLKQHSDSVSEVQWRHGEPYLESLAALSDQRRTRRGNVAHQLFLELYQLEMSFKLWEDRSGQRVFGPEYSRYLDRYRELLDSKWLVAARLDPSEPVWEGGTPGPETPPILCLLGLAPVDHTLLDELLDEAKRAEEETEKRFQQHLAEFQPYFRHDLLEGMLKKAGLPVNGQCFNRKHKGPWERWNYTVESGHLQLCWEVNPSPEQEREARRLIDQHMQTWPAALTYEGTGKREIRYWARKVSGNPALDGRALELWLQEWLTFEHGLASDYVAALQVPAVVDLLKKAVLDMEAKKNKSTGTQWSLPMGVGELARIIGCHPNTMRGYLKKQLYANEKFGKRYRIDLDSVSPEIREKLGGQGK